MKYIIMVPDGASDLPLDEYQGKTPFEIAHTSTLDFFAKHGKVGRVNNVPEGMIPGSDVANLSLLGYDPKKAYTGRGPFEAQSMGVDLLPSQIAFRCNLVTVADNKMQDYSAGHISTDEAGILISFLNEKLGNDAITFYPGISYRHLVVIDIEKLGVHFDDLACVAPHDILHQDVSAHIPNGMHSHVIRDLMSQAAELLVDHPVNRKRQGKGASPASMIWLWGFGPKPQVTHFYDIFGLKGALISAVDLLKGIAVAIDIDVLDVPGITGYYDTDYDAKARYGIQALQDHDFLFLHVESPDEAGHNGHVDEKIKAIENIDAKILKPICEHFDKEAFRILIAPDHPTPVKLQTHTSDDVPFLIYGNGIAADESQTYSETTMRCDGALVYANGYELIHDFLTQETL